MSLFARWAGVVARRRRMVLIVSTVAVVAGAALAPVFQSKLLGGSYETPGTESYAATKELAKRTGLTERALLVVSSERYTADQPSFREALRDAVATVREVDPELAVQAGEVSPDRRAAYATIGFRGPAANRQKLATEIQERVDGVVPPGIEAGLAGSSALLADLRHVEQMDIIKAEIVGLPLAAIILLVAFGSVVAAGLPLLLGICGVLGAFGAIAGLMLFMDFNSYVESIVAMIGLGVGIDYALLVVRRFREERAVGEGDEAAMARTLATAGRTVTFSGAILCTSLIPFAILDLPFLGEAAIGCMVVVAVMVVLALTALPAALLKLGDRLDRWRVPRRAQQAPGNGWDRWARAVMRRPWRVLVAGVSVLVLAATPAAGLRTGIDRNARAIPAEESVKALTSLESHFPAATLAPVEVLVRGAGEAARAARSVLVADDRVGDVRLQSLGREAALLLAAPTVGFDTKEAETLVRDLRRDLRDHAPAGTEVLVTGITAEAADFTDKLSRLTPWVIALSLVLAFVLLVLVFRSPLLAVKAIAMNMLSIGAAFGLVVLFFQDGLGEQIFDFTGPGYIQAWTPLTLFMLLFGLSMDYEVFMVSRMREEWERSGSTHEAVAIGLQRTGGVVTSAAAIMVAIFASWILTSIPELKQAGFGLAVAVLIDATIVRAALVPAFMSIAGRWNWWIPTRLERLLPRLEHG